MPRAPPRDPDSLFTRGFYLFCNLWVYVSIAAPAMIIAVWMMILIQNLDEFQTTMGTYMGNDVNRYPPGDPENGYVNNTNIPKHLGGPVFSAVFDVAMIVFTLISTASDLFWRFPFFERFLISFGAPKLWDEKKGVKSRRLHVVANCFLKLFIIAATGAQTYVGLQPDNSDVDTPLFCVYAVFCYLGSILPTGFVLLILFAKQAQEDDASRSGR